MLLLLHPTLIGPSLSLSLARPSACIHWRLFPLLFTHLFSLPLRSLFRFFVCRVVNTRRHAGTMMQIQRACVRVCVCLSPFLSLCIWFKLIQSFLAASFARRAEEKRGDVATPRPSTFSHNGRASRDHDVAGGDKGRGQCGMCTHPHPHTYTRPDGRFLSVLGIPPFLPPPSQRWCLYARANACVCVCVSLPQEFTAAVGAECTDMRPSTL